MGTCSYVLTGTEQGMNETFGSTCHGAVSNILCLGPEFICICSKKITRWATTLNYSQ